MVGPAILPFIPDGIPSVIRSLDRFAMYVHDGEHHHVQAIRNRELQFNSDGTPRWDKAPYIAAIPSAWPNGLASVNNAATLKSWKTALNVLNKCPERYQGIGVVLPQEISNTAPVVCCIDIDHCITDDDGNRRFSELAEDMIDKIPTYTEISPSGDGIHIFFFTTDHPYPEKPNFKKNGQNGIEFFSAAKFIRLSGNCIGTQKELNYVDASVVKYIYNRYGEYYGPVETETTDVDPAAAHTEETDGGNDSQLTTVTLAPTTRVSDVAADVPRELTDDEIIERIIRADYNGKRAADVADYFQNGYPSGCDESEIDMLVVGKIAYFANNDFSQIERVWSRSALRRPKLNREDYRRRTIQQAIQGNTTTYTGKSNSNIVVSSRKQSSNTVSGPVYEWPRLNSKGFPIKKEMDNVQYFVENILHLTLKRNLISRQTEIWKGERNFTGFLQDSMVTVIYSRLQRADYNVPIDVLYRYLDAIADKNRYNPLTAYLEKCYAELGDDKTDYINELWEILNVREYEDERMNELLKDIFKRWFVQGVCLAYNDDGRTSPDFCLVMQGGQGYGKSYFFKNFYPHELNLVLSESKIDVDNKDDVIQVTRYGVTELAEFSRSLRDMDNLKRFLTSPADVYRVPFGRIDARYPRRTNFCGTVNDATFLVDKTGSRRFPVLSLQKAINRDRINSFWKDKREKLHGQAYRLAIIDRVPFGIRDGEAELLDRMNERYRRKSDVELLLLDSYNWDVPIDERPQQWWTPTQINRMLVVPPGVLCTPSKVGVVLQEFQRRGMILGKSHSNHPQYQMPPKIGEQTHPKE